MGADAKESALTEYYVRRYNLANKDAEYTRNRPTLQMVTRNGERLKQGDGFYVTVRIADGWTGSPDFTTGMKYFNVSKKVRWFVGDPYAQYGRVTFDGLVLARNNVGTLIDIKQSEVDGAANSMLDTCEFEMWNDGTGKRFQISASGLGGTAAARQFTPVTISDAYNSPVNSILQFNTAADGSGATRTDLYRVDNLDPVNGVIYATRISGSANDVAASDYAFAVGSMNAYMPGIPTFIPASAPNDTIYGVTRNTPDPSLAGWRFNFTNSISETIQRSFATMGRWVNRAAGKYMVCLSTTDWLLLSLEREGRVIPDPQPVQMFGLEGLRVRTPFGPITCVAIPQLADGRGYIIDWTTWTLYTLGNLPHVIDDDGKVFQRLAPDGDSTNMQGDGIEMRFRIWKALLCDMPMSNATFPTA